ncbi:trichohyalin isoform X2 [Exaiptasia diaphana]|uniref:Uncharacterized protein n=1 Tax=Exaiptasia diaphana TaxID=2652724 RepID=A0A913XX69_EXADI|nr:trichohyalin isoform X2 [Exaiptasia diaphana]
MSPQDLHDVISLLMFYRILLGLVVKSILLQLFFGEFLNADETGCAEENDDGENSIHSNESCGQQWPNDDLLQQPMQETGQPEEGLDHPLENLQQRRDMMEEDYQWDNAYNLALEEQIQQLQCYMEARREEEVQHLFTQLEEIKQHQEQLLIVEMEEKRQVQDLQLSKEMDDRRQAQDLQLRKEMDDRRQAQDLQLRKEMDDRRQAQDLQLRKEMDDRRQAQDLQLRKEMDDRRQAQDLQLRNEMDEKRQSQDLQLRKEMDDRRQAQDLQLCDEMDKKRRAQDLQHCKEMDEKRRAQDLQLRELATSDVPSELKMEELSSMQEEGDIHDGTYATEELEINSDPKTQPLQRSINPCEELKKLQIQRNQNMRNYEKEMIDDQLEGDRGGLLNQELASAVNEGQKKSSEDKTAPNHQLTEIGNPGQLDMDRRKSKPSPTDQVDSLLPQVKHDNEQYSLQKEQQKSQVEPKIKVLDQLLRDRGKSPNLNQELHGIETKEMNSEGAAAPNHQLSAEDSGQFSMTTSEDEKPWKEDGKKNQASQTEETSPPEKWEKSHDG